MKRFLATTGLFLLAVTAPPVLAEAAMAFSVPAVDFGPIFTSGRNQQVQLKHSGTVQRALQVELASTNPAFTVSPASLKLEIGATATVTVSFKPPAPGPFDGAITASAPVGKTTLKLSGSSNKVTLDPESRLVFEKINVGQTAKKSLTVKNQGPSGLTCQLTLPDSGTGINFTVASPSFTVAPNGQTPVEFTFAARDLSKMTTQETRMTVTIRCNEMGPAFSFQPSVIGQINVIPVSVGISDGHTLPVQLTGDPAASIGAGIRCVAAGGGGATGFASAGGGSAGKVCQGVVSSGAQVSMTLAGTGASELKWDPKTGSASGCANKPATQPCAFAASAPTTITFKR